MPSAEQAVARPSAKRMAVDANLMLAMDVRRFLCAMQEVTGGSLLVTQRVFHEAWERCAEVSAKPAKRTVAHQAVGGHNVEGPVKRVEFLTKKLTIGWRDWAMAERQKAADAAWQYVERGPLATSLQMRLLTSSQAFRGKSRYGDSLAVAEALENGADLIASNNFDSILHEVLNEWILAQHHEGDELLQHVQAPFILRPDSAVKRRIWELGEPVQGWSVCQWALSACLPKSIEDEGLVDTVARRFLSNISKGGLAHSASDALEFLDDVQAEHPSGWLAVLNPQRAVRTQSAEDRRLTSIEAAHP